MTEEEMPAKRQTSARNPQRIEFPDTRTFRMAVIRSVSATDLLPLGSGKYNEKCLIVYAVPASETTLMNEKNRTPGVDGLDSIDGTNIMADSSGSTVKTI